MAWNMTGGYLVPNFKIAKRSIAGSRRRVHHLNLGRFSLPTLPAVAFSHWVLTHLHSDLLIFLLTSPAFSFLFYPFPFFKVGEGVILLITTDDYHLATASYYSTLPIHMRFLSLHSHHHHPLIPYLIQYSSRLDTLRIIHPVNFCEYL